MSARKIKGIFWLVVVAILVLTGITSIYRIDEGEQALVLTFGELTKTNDKAGLYWHIPIAQKIQRQSTSKEYTFEYGFRTTSAGTTTQGALYDSVYSESIMITSDQNIVSVEAIYQVVVTDAAQFFYEVDDPFVTLRFAFETVIRRNVQSNSLDDAMIKKKEISADVKEDFNELLRSYNIGVSAQQVEIQNIVVPAEVEPAYKDVINAENEKQRKTDEAEKYYYQVVPQSEAQAYKMIQDAEAYKAETIASAQGDVAVFNAVYDKYKQSPDITRTRLYIETIERIMNSASSKYIIENTGEGTIKFLPIGGE